MTHTAETLQQAFRYLFPDEVAALKELARSLPDNPTVVNIGAGAGTSGLAFMESREDLRLVTIDITKESSPFGCLAAEEGVLKEAGLWGERNRQIHGDSKDVGFGWLADNEPVDMVFIDGDHSYRGCIGDIIRWLPNIKPGGILAIHDYDKERVYSRDDLPVEVPHPQAYPGVDQSVDEMIAAGIEVVLHVDTLIAFRVGAIR